MMIPVGSVRLRCRSFGRRVVVASGCQTARAKREPQRWTRTSGDALTMERSALIQIAPLSSQWMRAITKTLSSCTPNPVHPVRQQSA
jgi:hypothetical protein